MALPLRLFLRYLVTVGVVAGMSAFLPQYVVITGGAKAFFVIGAVLFVLNLFARPVLNLLTLPLRIFLFIVALIIVNGVFVWLLVKAMEYVDPALAQFTILGGWTGFAVVAIVLGLANWLMKNLLR